MDFIDKVAIVTGGANGLGKAFALALASGGSAVMIADIDEAGLKNTAGEIAAAGGRCSFQKTDMGSKGDIAHMVSRTVDTFGTIDILVNCAGGSAGVPKVPVEDIREEDWDKVVNLNFKGTFLCTQAVIPAMKRQGKGKIVNLSSVTARINSVLTPVQYTSSKGAVSTFTRHIAGEVGPYGINVNAVAPGIILTPRLAGMWNERRSEEERQAYIEKIPLRRLGTVQDVVNSVLFLCSEKSDYITGITLDLNGGLFSV